VEGAEAISHICRTGGETGTACVDDGRGFGELPVAHEAGGVVEARVVISSQAAGGHGDHQCHRGAVRGPQALPPRGGAGPRTDQEGLKATLKKLIPLRFAKTTGHGRTRHDDMMKEVKRALPLDECRLVSGP
jgi:hypothetical protein